MYLGSSLTQSGRASARMEVVGEGERRVGRAVVVCEDIDSEEDSGFMSEEDEFERMVEERTEVLSNGEREVEDLDTAEKKKEAKVEEEITARMEEEDEG